jgi:hypothetical protein
MLETPTMPNRATPIIRRPLLFAALAIVGLSFTAVLVMVHPVPESAITSTRIIVTSGRIEAYLNEYKRLPETLDQLPPWTGDPERDAPVDLWKRPLLYDVHPDGTFTIRSLGRDGQAGGTGDDTDFLERFEVVDWEVHNTRWKPPATTSPAKEAQGTFGE